MLPETATLSELSPNLLKHQELPGLWSSDEITVQDLHDYFAGGHVVSIPKEGYEEPLTIPKCEPAEVDAAVSQAVEQGILWLISGPASLLNETVPAGVLSASASLRPPPDPDSGSGFDGHRNPRCVAQPQNKRPRACHRPLQQEGA